MAAVPNPEDGESPGKRRTWWHPLFARLLEWSLSDSCEVRDEVSVGRMPLRLDYVLIRLLGTALPETAFRNLPAISRRLNVFTLIELKSPVDALERGDWNKFMACAHLFVAQAQEPIDAKDLTLIFLAPAMTQSFRGELESGRQSIVEEESGIHRVEGGAFTTYVVETDRLAGLGEPVLTLFSHAILENPGRIAENMRNDYSEMFSYVVQQIEQYRIATPGFEVQHMIEKMNQTFEEFEEAFLSRIPVERRLRGIPLKERLQGIAAKERLQGISAEERLQGIPAEERLQGLSEQERERLRKLLDDESPSAG